MIQLTKPFPDTDVIISLTNSSPLYFLRFRLLRDWLDDSYRIVYRVSNYSYILIIIMHV